MTNIKVLLIGALGLALIGIIGCKRGRQLEGYKIKAYSLERKDYYNDYKAYNSTPTNEELSDYIKHVIDSLKPKNEKKRYSNLIKFYLEKKTVKEITQSMKDLAVESLAADIIKVCKCFHIDIFYFTGLIQWESVNFNIHAVSPTDAVGIPQFTTVAIQEVSQLLGIPKKIDSGSNAEDHVVKFYTDIMQRCMKSDSWFPYWKKGQRGGRKTTYKRIKQIIKINPTIGLTFAGVLLNEKLALALRGRSGNPDSTYRESYKKYNAASKAEQKKHEKESAKNTYAFLKHVKAHREKVQDGSETDIKLLAVTGRNLDIVAHYDEKAVVNYLDSSFQVRELQATLKFRGLIDKIDGTFGPNSAIAVCKALGYSTWPKSEKFCEQGWNIHLDSWYKIMAFTHEDITKFKSEIAEKFELRESEQVQLSIRKQLALNDGGEDDLDNKKSVYLLQRILQVRGMNLSPDGDYGNGTKTKLLKYMSERYDLKNLIHMDYDGTFVDDSIWDYLFYQDIPNTNN